MFLWLGDWIQTLQYGKDCRRLSVDVEIAPRFANRVRTVTHLVFAPGRGTHVRYVHPRTTVCRLSVAEQLGRNAPRGWLRILP